MRPGTRVILKPSEFTPLSGRRLVAILEEAGLPAGAIGIVFGAREAGETLVTHPGVDAIGFVGRTAPARRSFAPLG